MKKLLCVVAVLACPVTAEAHDRYGYGRHYEGNGMSWVAPAIVGGFIGYELSRPHQPQVIYAPQPPIMTPYVAQPYGYHWETILDSACACYRSVLVPN